MKKPIIGRRRRRRNAVRGLLQELPNLFKLVFRLLRDPRVPVLQKVLFGAVAVYMAAPLDLIPDFLVPLGWVDDLYLLGLALSGLMSAAGPATLLRHWDGNPAALGYLVEGVEDIGESLPQQVRRRLGGIARNPGRWLRREARPVRRIRVDEESRVHVDE